MVKHPNPAQKISNPTHNIPLKAALIYNPHAGTKRKMFPSRVPVVTLEDIKETLKQYQIPVDYFPTKRPGHATQLAREVIKKGYKFVIAAGGDGTVGEVANGLVGSDVNLGIIPLGSFMNVAKMLSIPTEIEKAVAIIKIGRTRKIDVGQIKFSSKKVSYPSQDAGKIPHASSKIQNTASELGYFIESAGLGLEAQLHSQVLEMEQGDKTAIFKMIKTLFEYYGHKATLTLDKTQIQTRAILIAVSNGPYTGASLQLAPKAKLNDHRLTVTLFKMTRWELLNYFFKLVRAKKRYSPKVTTYQAKKVKIETGIPRKVHADARHFGTTPVEFEIIPNALNVIAGFPKKGETALMKRTYLDY